MPVPQGIICAWPSTAALIPPGWNRAAALDGYHVRGFDQAGGATDPGAVGGAGTHGHTGTGHTHAFSLSHSHPLGSSNTGTLGTPAGGGSAVTLTSFHAHSGGTVAGQSGTGSTGSAATTFSPNTSNDPAYLAVIWIQSDGTPTALPSYALAYWNSTTLPPGWAQHPGAKAAYLKGAAVGTDGGVGGGSNGHTHPGGSHTHAGGSGHTHAGTTATGSGGSSAGTNSGGAGLTNVLNAHTHATALGTIGGASGGASIATSGVGNAEPPYVVLGILQNISGSPSWPLNVIALWIGATVSIPAGWTLCTGASGTPDLRTNFARGADALSSVGTTGGGTTHTHTGGGGTHSHADTHTHAQTVSTATSGAGNAFLTGAGTATIDLQTHSHGPASDATAPVGYTTDTATDTAAGVSGDSRPSFLDVAFLQYQVSGTVAVTSPTAGGTVATPEVAAAWTLSGGRTQATYRVQIATDAGMTAIAFDTGTVVSATQSATVPAAPAGPPYAAQYGFVRGMTYYFQVTAADVNGVTSVSSAVNFTAAWTAPTVPSGLTVTPNTVALPYLGLIWTQVVPGGSDVFAHYNLYRRVTGTSAWTRIATVTVVTTVTYADYNAEPGTAYDYAISATYTRSGSVFESALSGSASGTLTFLGIYLHVATDPTAYCRWLGNASQVSAYQAQTLVQAWGRQVPSAYVGEAESVSYQLTSIADVPHTSQANWKAVLPLMQAQRTAGAVIHYRNGVTQQSTFGLLSGQQPSQAAMGSSSQSNVLTRRDTLTNTQTTIGIVPVSYSEAA